MQVYLVGGAVRDQLLGLAVQERDWVVVGGTPEALIAQGYQAVGRDFPVFLHPKTKEEYALARTERKQGHGYHGFTCYAAPDVSLEQDLQRRDLTINAMALSDTGKLIDPYQGYADLQAGILRHVSEAFIEDPLRVLRVARFAARYAHLGFTIAPETLALMRALVAQGELAHLAQERVWKETCKALLSPSPEVYFQVLAQVDAQALYWPELDLTALQRYTDFLHVLPTQAQAYGRDQAQHLAALWAGLGLCMPEPAWQQVQERLKVPKHIRQFALHSQWFYTYTLQTFADLTLPKTALKAHAGADWAFACLNHVDAWRKPLRFQQYLAWMRVLWADHPQILDQLQNSYQQAQAIQVKQLQALGYQGAALGNALQQARLKCIQALWLAQLDKQ
ncbi:tRNA nucleotidyltransferase (CCA-adding enzyme) [Allopseudospirillum japonicum]|uniref:tRNA nucleotidyltransferase (CCA-adding enzyme) n=1 Tax=Allopseudospirillum japonicum TaxID=64971 RepID=A0A1H6RML5_9GAMM|nr:hypothetical protein [Allopseudospirillum japonicum]SEI57001.1 tRNA nucleotidyltransferase (CCA-adding enzyme) [Allopseudospirillum japonicum]